MPDTLFKALDSGLSMFTGYNNTWSDGVALPQGRAMKGGSRNAMITGLYFYVSGSGGTRTVSLELGNASTGQFNVGAASSPQNTGWRGTNSWVVNGGTARAQINKHTSGNIIPGRGSGGTTSTGNGSAAQSFGGGLAGYYRWCQAPTAPGNITLALVGPDEVSLSFNGPSDDGDTPITGYRVFYWPDGEGTDDYYKDFNPGTSKTIDGLDPGKTYNFRVSARNAVTNASNDVGVASGVSRIFIPSGGKIFVDGSWRPAKVRVWWDGQWRPANVQVWTNSAWSQAK